MPEKNTSKMTLRGAHCRREDIAVRSDSCRCSLPGLIAMCLILTSRVIAAAPPGPGTFVALPKKGVQTSVWSQSIDTRRIDTTRPAECRENLGVYPVGNGRCFAYLGIGFPQNTLFMMTGPRYQTDGNHNPLGGFGELALSLHEGEKAADLPLQSCRTVRGAPVVLTAERGTHWKLTTVTAAPPGVTAIVRWITVERLKGKKRDVTLALEFRGRPMKSDRRGFYFEYPHRNRLARLRPVMIGGKLKQDDKKLTFSIPDVAPGKPRTFCLALLFSESTDAASAVRKLVVSRHDRLLADTLAWWKEKLADTVHVTSGDRRLDDLVEGLKVLLLVQQDAHGGVCPMVNFKGVWLRDSNGPLLGFLHSGLYDNARRLLTYYRQASALHGFTAREFPLDLPVESDPDLTPDKWAASGTDRCEVPSFVVLQHAWWLDATGDKTLLKRHWHYVRRNAIHQVLIDGPHGPLQTFNGDETYMGGAYYSLFPTRSGYPNALIRPDAYSADSMFEYVAAHEAMVRLARIMGQDDDCPLFQKSADRMRKSIERHFWLPEEKRYAPALSPVTFQPHRAPFAPINLRPLWVGYLSPDDRKAKSNLDGTLRWLWRPPGLVRMTPFMDHFIGCAPGYLVSNLAAVRDPRAPAAFAALIGSASKSGEWVEVHKPDRPSYGYGDGRYANRLRPWESGVNLDALLFYLTGARRKEGRSVTIGPLLPAKCDRLVVENIPLGPGRLKLTVTRDGRQARYTVANSSRHQLTVNGKTLAPGDSFQGAAPLPAPFDRKHTPRGPYREPLGWNKGAKRLVITARKQPPADGVQLLDVGLPFSASDFAAFLAKRPAGLKQIEIDSSAQHTNRATLKPLMQILNRRVVKKEVEKFQKDGGRILAPHYLRAFEIHGPLPDPDQTLLKKDPPIIAAAYKADQWTRRTSPSSYINLDAMLRPNDGVAALARCVLVTQRPQRVTLALGADDGVVMWVGGRRVVERLGHHHHQFGRDKVTVDLPKGETPIIVGVHEINGAWGFSLRINDDKGMPPKGITVKP